MHFCGTVVCGDRIYDHVSRIWCGTSLILRQSLRHPLGSPGRRSSLLGHRFSRGAVQCNQGPDTQNTQDYSARCDVLLSGYIHFTPCCRDVLLARKRKLTATSGPLSSLYGSLIPL